MKINVMVVLLLPILMSHSALALEQEYVFVEAKTQQQFEQLIKEFRCVTCPNQTIADSDAPLAKDLRDEVYQQVLAGKTELQIKKFLVERYGDFILFNPPIKNSTILLWGFPGMLLLLGIVVAIVVVRRHRKN